MPVTDVHHDLDSLTLTVTAQFAAAVQRIWEIYADPRQLERIWGPPGFPATVVDHNLIPGGRVTYFMTGPDGERYHGFWEVLETDEPHSFLYRDGFSDETFTPDPELPFSTCTSSFSAEGGGTRAVYMTRYDSREALQTVLDMGVEEGARASIDQIDALLLA